MTCRYNQTEAIDVLYTSVRATPGGVADAANFLTQRRGKNITAESLRLRLRTEGDNRLSMEMFELLIEWMDEKRQPHALDALHALNEQFGLRAVPFDETEADESVNGLMMDTLHLSRQTGNVAAEVRDAVADGKITHEEAGAITKAVRKNQRVLDGLVRKAQQLSKIKSR